MAQAPVPDGSSSAGLGGYLDTLTGKTTSTTNAAPLSAPAGQPRNQAGQLAGSDFTSGFTIKSVLDLGMSFLGKPYVWGGASPDTGFDCSGLVQYIYGKNGVALPRVAHDQAGVGVAVSLKSAQPGDLVFFDNNRARPGADHVGIYLGGGKMLQAPRTGKNIEVVNVDLSKAMTIRRVAPNKPTTYNGLGSSNGQYVYIAKVTANGTRPTAITPAKGGGDAASNPTAQGTTTAPAAGGGPLPANATPQQIKDEVARSYGYLAAFLSDKEIGPILTRAAMEDWDEAKLTGALTATTWWKTHSDATRQWDALNRLDPAKAKAQLDSQMSSLRQQAQDQGIILTGLQLHDMSVNALRFGWNAAQITDALQQQGKHDPRAKTARDYDRLKTEDPASAATMLNDALTGVRTRAQEIGVAVSDKQATALAESSIRGGWDASRLTDELLRTGVAGGDPNHPGALQTQSSGLKAMADSYLVPLSDQTLADWSKRIVAGQSTSEDFTTYLKDQAKILRPWMSKQIDAGLTVAQYADPFKQLAARELEISPDQVDLTNPRFARLIDGTVDKNGQRTPMSLSDAQTYLRTLPEWSQTKQAHAQTADLAQGILTTLGKIA